MRRLARKTLQVTFVLLVASVALIAPSLVGIAGSLALAAVQVAVSVGLFAVRDHLASVERVWYYEPGEYLGLAWVGPLVAAVIVVAVGLETSPGELQALGGLCGLIAMLNYFLRPVYATGVSLVRRASQRLG